MEATEDKIWKAILKTETVKEKKKRQKTKFFETEEESFSIYLVTYVVSL
jgi:hypothetical protein